MKVLVTYDVATADKAGEKRLRRIAQACEDYGQRVQKSVFECLLGDREWILLKRRLLDEMEPAQDSLRFYFLESNTRVECHGVNRTTDMEGPLIV